MKLTHQQWVAKYCPDEPANRGIVMMAAPAVPQAIDPDAGYRQEYNQTPQLARMGITVEQYIDSRQCTEQRGGQVVMQQDDEPTLWQDKGDDEPAPFAVGSRYCLAGEQGA